MKCVSQIRFLIVPQIVEILAVSTLILSHFHLLGNRKVLLFRLNKKAIDDELF